MGAPGAHAWQGQVFAHDLKTDLSKSTSSINPFSEDDSLLGYSMALGQFTSKSQASSRGSDTDLAIGIPRADDLTGKVMVVDNNMRLLYNVSGEQAASRFGDTLLVMDINNDGLDDLLVGAPNHYNSTMKLFDRGRVYVYLQDRRHELNLVQRISGLYDGDRLGTSLANAGDLNRDGFPDVALGAPHGGPRGRGVVYIFMGRKGGLSEEPEQIILAESVNEDANLLKGFGYSLSGGLDLDGNHYPDLLVGSYSSDRAVLLRSRQVVKVISSLNFQPRHFNLIEKTCVHHGPAIHGTRSHQTTSRVSCINVQYCSKYSGFNVDPNLSFHFNIKLDPDNKGAPRLFFLNEPETKAEDQREATLLRDVSQCRQFKVYVLDSMRDKLTPLKVDVEYQLAANQTFNALYNQQNHVSPPLASQQLRPILNRSDSKLRKLSEWATIQKHCGRDNVCVPDLKLIVNPNLEEYTIGSNEKLILDVIVKNQGEDAFESMLYLTMPSTLSYIGINKTRNSTHDHYPICYGAKPEQTGVNMLNCDLGNPMNYNENLSFSIITEPIKGVFMNPDFTFVAQVNSSNLELDERHYEDNLVAIGIPINLQIDLFLSASSDPSFISYNSSSSKKQQLSLGQTTTKTIQAKSIESDLGPEIYHTYRLQNRGPSVMSDIELTIFWPAQDSDGRYLLYLVDEPSSNDKVFCQQSKSDSINPLNLKYSRESDIFVINEGRDDNIVMSSYPRRYVRDVVETSASLPYEMQLGEYCGSLPCNQMHQFKCHVKTLSRGEVGSIKIRSRLYEETIDHYISSSQEFALVSKLEATVKSFPLSKSSPTQSFVLKLETPIYSNTFKLKDLFSLWVIIWGSLLGLILLFILVLFLKRVGFFKRTRPPKMPTEREPLTTTIFWNSFM